jgi:hypothetical protein
MTEETTRPNHARTLLATSALIAALGHLAATGAAAQSTKAAPHCNEVGGTVMTNFLDPGTTLGTATGDLRGGVSATLLGAAAGPNETTVFSVQHHWVSEAGDTIEVAVAQATAAQPKQGLFAILSYPLTITGGTGRFANATGTLENIGVVDLNTQRTVFRYTGSICFSAPAN